ncbi:hypothetical protein GGX14DRAFT_393403 [Mycena pura]|uniref:Uncharacterized protein n=1 Tax=Mycena pura TaxID=153505 RepID=A0AAD6VK76_9AGAR|nr:hypothetical protein GGX14DRAFT_393403 [Mycena pura]
MRKGVSRSLRCLPVTRVTKLPPGFRTKQSRRRPAVALSASPSLSSPSLPRHLVPRRRFGRQRTAGAGPSLHSRLDWMLALVCKAFPFVSSPVKPVSVFFPLPPSSHPTGAHLVNATGPLTGRHTPGFLGLAGSPLTMYPKSSAVVLYLLDRRGGSTIWQVHSGRYPGRTLSFCVYAQTHASTLPCPSLPYSHHVTVLTSQLLLLPGSSPHFCLPSIVSLKKPPRAVLSHSDRKYAPGLTRFSLTHCVGSARKMEVLVRSRFLAAGSRRNLTDRIHKTVSCPYRPPRNASQFHSQGRHRDGLFFLSSPFLAPDPPRSPDLPASTPYASYILAMPRISLSSTFPPITLAGCTRTCPVPNIVLRNLACVAPASSSLLTVVASTGARCRGGLVEGAVRGRKDLTRMSNSRRTSVLQEPVTGCDLFTCGYAFFPMRSLRTYAIATEYSSLFLLLYHSEPLAEISLNINTVMTYYRVTQVWFSISSLQLPYLFDVFGLSFTHRAQARILASTGWTLQINNLIKIGGHQQSQSNLM